MNTPSVTVEAVPGAPLPTHRVRCEVCGLVSERVLAVAADEERTWHQALHAAGRTPAMVPGSRVLARRRATRRLSCAVT